MADDVELPMIGPLGASLDLPRPPEETRLGGGESQAEPASMRATALVFLDDPIARRLVVAWETCGPDRPTQRQWLETAGYAGGDQDVQRMAKALMTNRICRDDGTVDVMALKYISTYVAGRLKLRGGRKESR